MICKSLNRWAFVVGAGMAIAGCGPVALPNTPADNPAPAAYLRPPVLVDAERLGDGRVRLSGRAAKGSEVRLRAPEGDRLTAKAGPDGGWLIEAPASPSPRLYALEAARDGRAMKGEGALAIFPAPGPTALTLRGGYAAAVAGRGRAGVLRLVAVDFDGSGLAAAGFAPPGTPVRLTVDGAALAVGQADADGAFALLALGARQGVGAGRHRVKIDTPQGLSTEQEVAVSPPSLPPDRFYSAEPLGAGWLVRWRLPGGGVQASRVFADVQTGSGH